MASRTISAFTKGLLVRGGTISPSVEAFDTLPDSALIDARDYALILRCSVNTIWRRTAAGILPKPIKVSPQQTRWRVGDVRQSLASLSVPGRCDQ